MYSIESMTFRTESFHNQPRVIAPLFMYDLLDKGGSVSNFRTTTLIFNLAYSGYLYLLCTNGSSFWFDRTERTEQNMYLFENSKRHI